MAQSRHKPARSLSGSGQFRSRLTQLQSVRPNPDLNQPNSDQGSLGPDLLFRSFHVFPVIPDLILTHPPLLFLHMELAKPQNAEEHTSLTREHKDTKMLSRESVFTPVLTMKLANLALFSAHPLLASSRSASSTMSLWMVVARMKGGGYGSFLAERVRVSFFLHWVGTLEYRVAPATSMNGKGTLLPRRLEDKAQYADDILNCIAGTAFQHIEWHACAARCCC